MASPEKHTQTLSHLFTKGSSSTARHSQTLPVKVLAGACSSGLAMGMEQMCTGALHSGASHADTAQGGLEGRDIAEAPLREPQAQLACACSFGSSACVSAAWPRWLVAHCSSKPSFEKLRGHICEQHENRVRCLVSGALGPH